jgi:hypothetical protein
MPYKIEELSMRDDSAEEQVRTRNIFEDLKKKVNQGETLSHHEIEFFCTCVKLGVSLDQGSKSDQ